MASNATQGNLEQPPVGLADTVIKEVFQNKGEKKVRQNRLKRKHYCSDAPGWVLKEFYSG